MTYSNKKIIIIGASSGIGRALAEFYASRGHFVAITGRRIELLEEIKKAYPQNIIFKCFDVMGSQNIEELQSLIQELGGLDLLIYNAGFGEPSESLSKEIDERTIKTNVDGFAEIARFGFEYFTKQGHGQIVGTSSIASVRGNSLAPAYSASKAFMSVYLEGLYIKAKKMKLNIAVTDIQPGFVKTKMAKGNKQFWIVPLDKAAQQIYAAIEAKRFRVYISKRWRLIAMLMKIVPRFIYRRIA
jgi:short-subunit dehydrogenase